MIKKTTIETQLDCRATAALRNSIVEDLSKPDKPIESLLSNKDEQKDESEEIEKSND